VSRRFFFRAGFFAAATALAGGCVSRAEFERVQREQREVRAMVADQNVALEALRRRLDILRQELSERGARGSGTVPVQLQQRVNELDARITAIEQRLALGAAFPSPAAGSEARSDSGALPPVVATPATRPQSPLEIALAREEAAFGSARPDPDYREGLNLVRQGQCAQAAVKLREFIRRNPKSDLADNAQYWIGACYFYQKEYGPAARELSDLMLRYPKGDKVPAALLMLADAFAASGETTDAKLVLRKLATEYPRTEEAEQAKQKLQALGN
jgi:tol-pal system protein YbgF